MKKLINQIGIGTAFVVLGLLAAAFTSHDAAAQLVKAALIRSADEPARNYVSLHFSYTPHAVTRVYAVPTGKILVIERLTNTDPGGAGQTAILYAYTPGTQDTFTIVLIHQGNENVRFYAKAGQYLEIEGGNNPGQVFAQGYLIDAVP